MIAGVRGARSLEDLLPGLRLQQLRVSLHDELRGIDEALHTVGDARLLLTTELRVHRAHALLPAGVVHLEDPLLQFGLQLLLLHKLLQVSSSRGCSTCSCRSAK